MSKEHLKFQRLYHLLPQYIKNMIYITTYNNTFLITKFSFYTELRIFYYVTWKFSKQKYRTWVNANYCLLYNKTQLSCFFFFPLWT